MADRGGGAPIGANVVPISSEANLSGMKIVGIQSGKGAAGQDVYLQISAQYADYGRIHQR